MIRNLLASESIGSQESLRSRLAQRGIDVTQTTLSRDLMDLRATKVRNASGALIYTVPDHDGGATHDGEAANVRLARWCQLLLVTSVKVGNQLVLRTQVGAANLLASSIDSVRREEVAGTIAGDDTILVICRSEEDASVIERMLLALAEPGALLGFLGPRVVELTTGPPIPEGVQTGENLARHGVIDGVISPSQLRTAVLKIVSVLFPAEKEEQDVDTRVLDTEVSVERSAWESITITRNPERPGLRHLVEALSPNTVALSGTGDGRTSRAVTVMLARIGSRPAVLIGQDRHKQPPLGRHPLGPSALRMARRGIQLAHELQLPLISIIDTPGAELSQHAEENAMAGSIARTLGELVDVDVPTVSIILGQGCGGGALAMLPSDRVLAAENAWLSPLPPEGASAIIYRDTSHAPRMMEEQRVSAQALVSAGIVDDIIPEKGDAAAEPEEFVRRTMSYIEHTIKELETSPQRVGREQRFQHYESLAKRLI